MPTIQLRTAIPGPRSRELMRRRDAAVPRGVSHATPIFAARAEGAIVEDVDGNRFLDFAGGIGCVNVGHRAPRVVAAIRKQIDDFIHTCFSVAPYGNYVELAEKLNSLMPGDFAKKTMLVNSGAEAMENAIKIARAYTRRPAIICFEDAFHGRTLLAMSLTSKTHPYKAGFRAVCDRNLSHSLCLLLPLFVLALHILPAGCSARIISKILSSAWLRPRRSPPSSSSRFWAKADSSRRRKNFSR